MRIADENELLEDVSLVLPTQHRILVFAPHPDDEVFGCGGTLCLLRDSGAEISIIILTDGALGGGKDDEDIVRTRAQESREALRILGLPAPEFWELSDRGLKYGEPLVERLAEKIKASRAELIFLPAPTEIHPDHQCLALAGMEALRRVGGFLQGAFYEISSPLPNPNLLLDISVCEQRKFAAMECFRSQLDQQPYADRISGLNAYRSFSLGPQVKCAEAFTTFVISDIDRVVPALFAGSLHQRFKSGFAVTASDIPLVSIVVRSMDLPTLGDALDSLALQTYSNVEVVVVNAKGGQHSPLAQTCGAFPLRLVNQVGEPLARSRAANVGLAACQGRYLGFLDDDDVIAPDHIHHLVGLLQKNKDKVVAYAGVEGLRRDDPGREVLHVFAEKEVSFPLLLMGNVIPIHAALFPAELLEEGISVDETLDIFEDWDLWLQMIRRVPFKYVDRITATYYSNGSSQVFPHNPDCTNVSIAKEAIFVKWSRLLGAVELQKIVNLYLQAQANSATCLGHAEYRMQNLDVKLLEKDQQLNQCNCIIKEKDEQLHQKMLELQKTEEKLRQKEDALHETTNRYAEAVSHEQAQLAEIFRSRSWRLTWPLRWCGVRARQLCSRRKH